MPRYLIDDERLIGTVGLLQELRPSDCEGFSGGRGDLSNRLLGMGEARNRRSQGREEKWAFTVTHDEYTSLRQRLKKIYQIWRLKYEESAPDPRHEVSRDHHVLDENSSGWNELLHDSHGDESWSINIL